MLCKNCICWHIVKNKQVQTCSLNGISNPNLCFWMYCFNGTQVQGQAQLSKPETAVMFGQFRSDYTVYKISSKVWSQMWAILMISFVFNRVHSRGLIVSVSEVRRSAHGIQTAIEIALNLNFGFIIDCYLYLSNHSTLNLYDKSLKNDSVHFKAFLWGLSDGQNLNEMYSTHTVLFWMLWIQG